MKSVPLTIADAGRALRAGDLSSRELTDALLARADRLDPKVGAYLSRNDQAARAAADRADRELASGMDRGPLHGIPYAVKDNMATLDLPTTGQSLALDRSWGAGRDATAVARLRAAGAVLLGKTTLLEFAHGFADDDAGFPVSRNPWDLSRWPGGSSTGTGVGVAAGFFPGGLGTDTGGSIRLPAAICGITGLKPTFGRVPKAGCLEVAASFGHLGPMARTARDCALMLGVLAGHDPADVWSARDPVPDYVAALDGSVAGLRVGSARPYVTHEDSGVDPVVIERVDRAVGILAEAGATADEIEVPDYDVLSDASFITEIAEAFEYHKENLKRRWDDYGKATRVIMSLGALLESGDYVQAQRCRQFGRVAVDRILDDVDVIITPTLGIGAPPNESVRFPGALKLPVFTTVWSFLGHPTISIPVGFTADGLPVGMQITGRWMDEATVLRVADAYQQRTSWHLELPPITRQRVGEDVDQRDS